MASVSGKKSARTFIGRMLKVMRELTAASRSLNLTAGGFCSLANCSRRSNSFMLSGLAAERRRPGGCRRCG